MPNKIVYDCLDPSPYYDSPDNPYFDENDLVELPQDDSNTDFRKYPYGSSNLTPFASNLNARGLRINRFYQKLKPYYVKQAKTDTTLVFESRFESGNLRRAV